MKKKPTMHFLFQCNEKKPAMDDGSPALRRDGAIRGSGVEGGGGELRPPPCVSIRGARHRCRDHFAFICTIVAYLFFILFSSTNILYLFFLRGHNEGVAKTSTNYSSFMPKNPCNS